MSQAMCRIIYGVPLTDQARRLIKEMDNFPEDLGFETLYSDKSSSSGYCGVKLDGLRECNDVCISDLRLTPTEKENKEALDKINALSAELRQACGKIDTYIIWYSS